MYRISVKSDAFPNRKIKLFPIAGNDELFRIELDRRVVKRPGQPESYFTREDALHFIAEVLDWDVDDRNAEPEPPIQLEPNTPVRIKSFDEDFMPRRRKTWTVGRPFLDWRGVWRVFCIGEKKAVKLELVEVGR